MCILTPTESANNGRVSIRTGTIEEGVLTWRVTFFFFTSYGRLVVLLTWGKDGDWMHYCKKASQQWLCDALRQCSAGKPWVLPFVWMRSTTSLNIAADQKHPFIQFSLMAVVSFSRMMYSPTLKMDQEWREKHNNDKKVGLQISQIVIYSSMCWTNKFAELKDVMHIAWWQIPWHSFRGLVESIPRQVRAVLPDVMHVVIM